MVINKNKIVAVTTAITLSFLSVMNFTSSADNNLLAYNKYNAQTGAFLGYYTLDSMPTTNNSRSIIYDDDRVVDWSKSGVVKIVSEANDNGYISMGTGFVVDEHTVATAAHVVFETNLDRIELYNSRGNLAMTATPVETHVPYDYASSTNKPTNFDYALVTVSEDLSDYMCFDLAVPLQTGISSNITGFPGTIYPEGGGSNGIGANGKMYTGTGTVTSITNGIISCDNFSSSGASGSPIYVSESYNGKAYNSVIGINSEVVLSYNGNTGEYIGRDAHGPVMSFNIIHFLINNNRKSY